MSRLERLLRPRSIAAIGGKFAARVVEQCQLMGYEGEIWPVHPGRTEMHGLPVYKTIEDLPAAPDAAFIGINRELSVEAVQALKAKGAAGAICYAAGFSELDDRGKQLQAELVAAAGEMPVFGPNCYGLINYCDGALLWPDQQGGTRLQADQQGVAIIAQSSNIAINFTMQQRGLPLAYVLTVGNQALVGMAEMALALLEDASVSVLGMYVEGFDSIEQMQQLAARSRELKKPVVILKVGKSEHSQRSAMSHTASLVGSHAANSAFLKRLGFGEAHSIPVFLETLKLLHQLGPSPGYRLSSMSCSGGEASIIADLAEHTDLSFPALSESHRQRVQEALGPMVSVANPLDYNTYCWGDREWMHRVYASLVSGEAFDMNLLVIDFPHGERCNDEEWMDAVDAFNEALRVQGARGALVCGMHENLGETYANAFMQRKLLCLFGMDEALQASQIAADIGLAWQKPIAPPLLTSSEPAGQTTLSEFDAKQELSSCGVPVANGRLVENLEQALNVADSIGYPLVAKAMGIAHKTEHNAVRLNLGDVDELGMAVTELLSLGSPLFLESMITDNQLELIIGITRDPQLGLILTLGSGGVLVEILQDSNTLLIPASRDDIETALRGLRCAPLFNGYRGKPAADINAAIDAIISVQDYAIAQSGQLIELDINPLIVKSAGNGAVAADALIIKGDPHHE